MRGLNNETPKEKCIVFFDNSGERYIALHVVTV